MTPRCRGCLAFTLALVLALAPSPRAAARGAQAQPERPRRRLGERLQIPPEVPGSAAPPIVLPDLKPENAARRKEAIDRLFPELPPLGPDPQPVPGPAGVPLTLADLQQYGLANSPAVRRAAAAVEAARGTAVQAGLKPNPKIGYEGDTIRQANSSGLQGGFVEQTIKTGGKLQLARAAALVDVADAEAALRRAEVDVLTQVRTGYFAVLVARETLRVNGALVRLVAEVYSIQVERVRAGQAAPYEPLGARALLQQARSAVVLSRNRYASAWKQLAAALGRPDLPPTELAGRADVLLQDAPHYDYHASLHRVVPAHTEVATAANAVDRARLTLRLAEVTPVPDVDLRYLVQKDNTTPPFNVVHSVAVGVQLPLWDRNQGAIRAARANLARAAEEARVTSNDLSSRLAAAYERYLNNLALLEAYRDRILPDQVRVYRGVYERYDKEPDVLNFPDVIAAQQNLGQAVQTYLSTLGALWESVVELGGLLQIYDLFEPLPPCPPAEPVSGHGLPTQPPPAHVLGHGLPTVPPPATEGLPSRQRGDLRSSPGARSGDRAPTRVVPAAYREVRDPPASAAFPIRPRLPYPR